MVGVIAQRLAQMVFVMAGISVLAFLIFFATPGADPAARIAGRNASPETVQQVRQSFGLDRPLPVQYALMMKRLFVTGDLTSFVNRGQRVIPVFWLGEVVNLVTQSRYHDAWLFSWVPALGYKPFWDDPWVWFKTMLLPWFSLAVLYIGLYGRVLRANLVEAYQEDFIRTARAKGLSPGRVLIRHALRTSLIPFVTLFGLDFGALVGGQALLTEVVFGLNGIGRLTYLSLQTLDLPVILATVIYASFFVVMANAVVDVVYALLDPRARSR